MCGIYGVAELREGRRPGEEVLAAMGEVMIHELRAIGVIAVQAVHLSVRIMDRCIDRTGGD